VNPEKAAPTPDEIHNDKYHASLSKENQEFHEGMGSVAKNSGFKEIKMSLTSGSNHKIYENLLTGERMRFYPTHDIGKNLWEYQNSNGQKIIGAGDPKELKAFLEDRKGRADEPIDYSEYSWIKQPSGESSHADRPTSAHPREDVPPAPDDWFNHEPDHPFDPEPIAQPLWMEKDKGKTADPFKQEPIYWDEAKNDWVNEPPKPKAELVPKEKPKQPLVLANKNLNDTILKDIVAGDLPKFKVNSIAKKFEATPFSPNKHWEIAQDLWNIAEKASPHTAEAIYRALPEETQKIVSRRIDALKKEMGSSPWDNIKSSPGKFLQFKTLEHKLPPHLYEDKIFTQKLASVAMNLGKTEAEAKKILGGKPTEVGTPTKFKPKAHGYANMGMNAPIDATNLVKAAKGDTKFIADELYKLSGTSSDYADEVFKKLQMPMQDLDKVVADWNSIEKAKGPAAGKSTKLAQDAIHVKNDPKGVAYLKDFLEPIKDWKSWKPKDTKTTIPYFPDPAAKARAEAAGTNTNFEIHRGGGHNNPHPEYPDYPETHWDPKVEKAEHEPAVFASDQSSIAEWYKNAHSNYKHNAVTSYVTRGKVFEVDWKEMMGGHASYYPEVMHNLLVAARQKGADMVVINRMHDVGGKYHELQNQYAIINPEILRSPKAKFDPAKLHLAKPLAGLFGGGLMVYGNKKKEDEGKMYRGGSALSKAMTAVKKYASGGHIPHYGGMIKSAIPGRTDKIPLNVPAGSYILPADIPSALGEGNTEAGGQILSKMFKMGVYGSGSTGGIKTAKMGRHGFDWMKTPRKPHFAEGGEAEGEDHVPVIAAGGEMVVPPHVVQEVGHGDISAGHRVLDQFVLSTRKRHIDTLKKLAPPKK